MTPYHPLEVLFGGNKVDGSRWWVRDDEEAHLWNLVEYAGRRLMCYCADGQAHAESPDTEEPCPHLTAAVEYRMAELRSHQPHRAPINAGMFVD